MKSALWQLYHGEVSPVEIPVPKSQEYQNSLNFLIKQEELFAQAYNAALPELEQMLDIQRDICAMETENMFCYGFCLGIQLMVESLYGKK